MEQPQQQIQIKSATSIIIDRQSQGSSKTIIFPIPVEKSEAAAAGVAPVRSEQKRHTNPTKIRRPDSLNDNDSNNYSAPYQLQPISMKQSFTNIISRFAVEGGVKRSTLLRRISSSNQVQSTSFPFAPLAAAGTNGGSSFSNNPDEKLSPIENAGKLELGELNSPSSAMHRSAAARKPLRYSNSIAFLRPQPLDLTIRTNNNNTNELHSSTTDMASTPMITSRRDLLSPFGAQHKKIKFVNELLKSLPSTYSKRFIKVFENSGNSSNNVSQHQQQNTSSNSLGMKTRNQISKISVALTSPVSAFKPDLYSTFSNKSNTPSGATKSIQAHQQTARPILKSRSTSTYNNHNLNTTANNINSLNEKQKSNRNLQFSSLDSDIPLISPRQRLGIPLDGLATMTPSTASSGQLHSKTTSNDNNPYLIEKNLQQHHVSQQQQIKKKLNGMHVGFSPTKQIGKFATPAGTAATAIKPYTTFEDLAEQAASFSKKQIINSLKPNMQALQIGVQEQAAQFFASKNALASITAATTASPSKTNLTSGSSTTSFTFRNSNSTKHFHSLQSPIHSNQHSHSKSQQKHQSVQLHEQTKTSFTQDLSPFEQIEEQHHAAENNQASARNRKTGANMLGLHLKNLFTKQPTQISCTNSSLTARLSKQSPTSIQGSDRRF